MLMSPRPSPRISVGDRALGSLPWALGALFGAVAIHLLAVLAMPALSPNASYRTLAMRLPLGDKEALPRPAAGNDAMLFADPFAALTICRYDLTQSPLRLRALADGDHPFSVSVRLADGAVVYSGNDRQTPHRRFNILLVTQAQADALDASSENSDDGGASDNTNNPPNNPADDVLRLISPAAKGFAVFRALSLREGDYEEAAAARTNIQCTVETARP
jgi:uncharacterized membrane protein